MGLINLPGDKPYVHPGALCSVPGATGVTKYDTPMTCKLPDGGGDRHRWRATNKAAAKAKRKRSRRSYKGAGINRREATAWTATNPAPTEQLPDHILEQLNAAQTAALHRAAGLPTDYPKPPRATDVDKLNLLGVVEGEHLTSRGADALRRVLGDTDPAAAAALTDGTWAAPRARDTAPAVDLDVDEPDTPMPGFERYDACTICQGKPRRACRNRKRSRGGRLVYCLEPHRGRPLLPEEGTTVNQPTDRAAAAAHVAAQAHTPGSLTFPRPGTACNDCRKPFRADGVIKSTQIPTLCTSCAGKHQLGTADLEQMSIDATPHPGRDPHSTPFTATDVSDLRDEYVDLKHRIGMLDGVGGQAKELHDRVADVERIAAEHGIDLQSPLRFGRRKDAAGEIRAAAQRLARDGDYISLDRLRAELPPQLSRADVDAALGHMMAADPNVTLTPEENQKTLTEAQRAAATHFGGQDQHLIAVRSPFDPAAAERAVTNPSTATDAELAMAQRAPRLPSAVYDQIRQVVRDRAAAAAPGILQSMAGPASEGGAAAVWEVYRMLPDDQRVAVLRCAGVTGGSEWTRVQKLTAQLLHRNG